MGDARRDAGVRIERGLPQLLDRQFIEERDPYGKRYPKAKGWAHPLQRTRRMRGGFTFTAVPSGTGILLRIDNTQDYSKFVNDGTERMDARKLVPDAPGRTLPREWADLMYQAYYDAFVAYVARIRSRHP